MWASLLLLLQIALSANAQSFRRLGTCPKLGCIFPPDQADFLAGQVFDIRLEVHAPVNGSEAYNNGVPDERFRFTINYESDWFGPIPAPAFFKIKEVPIEKWTFNYFEDLYASDAKTPSVVNVAAKAYRKVALYKPGHYTAKLTYFNGQTTVARWTVRPFNKRRKAKNVILFIGDGMTIPMATAARLIAHKTINGKYQSLLQLDQMEALGLQMTHSIDTFITDSANSATALYSGHKSTVNALNVYADSSPDPFDDPKFETIAEIFRRRYNGKVGIVSTAYLADATPAGIVAHTRARSQSAAIVDMFLHGQTNYSWTNWNGPDVLFGGGAENFFPPATYQGKNYYDEFAKAGYNVVYNNTGLKRLRNDKRALGVFSVNNMAKWLDREVYPENLKNQSNSPTGDKTDAVDQPGLKEMTLKAIDILSTRARKDKSGFFIMSEAASIDKMMHVLDYDRALGELLELDDTLRATIQHLKKIGEYDDTLIVVTADHGHGFDVIGGVDTKYLAAQSSDRAKRNAVGVYERSGESGYTVAPGSLPNNQTIVIGPQGPNFPVQWNPRYTLAAGVVANPDHREDYTVRTKGPRLPATLSATTGEGYVVNPNDGLNGFTVNGNIPVGADQGVHSLTDVAVYANGPGSEAFRGIYSAIDVFFKMADALALGTDRPSR